jgi:hypothetical protein
LELPVPRLAAARPQAESFAELVRDAFVLDLALAPPRASALTRAHPA